jgi:hypothetical protein
MRENNKNLRVIETARTEKAINEAIKNGFQALIKPVVPSPDIKSKYAIIRDKATGLIEVIHDYRTKGYDTITHEHSTHDVVVPFTYYYPHHFKSPFAAYLIPPDIQVGEVVLISDLIEDVVSDRWNQGDTFRLESCEAIWNGKHLNIKYNIPDKKITFVG